MSDPTRNGADESRPPKGPFRLSLRRLHDCGTTSGKVPRHGYLWQIQADAMMQNSNTKRTPSQRPNCYMYWHLRICHQVGRNEQFDRQQRRLKKRPPQRVGCRRWYTERRSHIPPSPPRRQGGTMSPKEAWQQPRRLLRQRRTARSKWGQNPHRHHTHMRD